MCRPATCKTCGKTTWAGCGQHVAQVRQTVPAGQWCAGRNSGSGVAPGLKSSSGLFRIFGR